MLKKVTHQKQLEFITEMQNGSIYMSINVIHDTNLLKGKNHTIL